MCAAYLLAAVGNKLVISYLNLIMMVVGVVVVDDDNDDDDDDDDDYTDRWW